MNGLSTRAALFPKFTVPIMGMDRSSHEGIHEENDGRGDVATRG